MPSTYLKSTLDWRGMVRLKADLSWNSTQFILEQITKKLSPKWLKLGIEHSKIDLVLAQNVDTMHA